MGLPFVIIAALTIAAAVAAMSLRNLVHCALALTVAFAGLAALYLQLDAQLAGFAQILVYIGAVAILIVFAILLTRGGEAPQGPVFSASWLWGRSWRRWCSARLRGASGGAPPASVSCRRNRRPPSNRSATR